MALKVYLINKFNTSN